MVPVVVAAAVGAAAIVPAAGSGQNQELQLGAQPSSVAEIANAGAGDVGSQEEGDNGPARAVGSEERAYAGAEEHS